METKDTKTGVENSATLGQTGPDTTATAGPGDSGLTPPAVGSDVYNQNIEKQNADIEQEKKAEADSHKNDTTATAKPANVPRTSLAATLAAKAAELKSNPDAPPLVAADTVVDPFAVGRAILDTPGHPSDLDKLDKGSAALIASAALDVDPSTATSELPANFAAPGEPFSGPVPVSSLEAPSGSFIAPRIPYLVLRNGSKVAPTNGFYVAQSQEEHDMLVHFVNTGMATFVE
jgi:hypothetical protein